MATQRTIASLVLPASCLGLLFAATMSGTARGQIRVSQPIPSSNIGQNRAPSEGDNPPPAAAPDAPRGGALGGYKGPDTGGAAAPAGNAPSGAPGTLAQGSAAETGDTGGGTPEEGGAPLTYDPEGRRDPFRPLTGEAADSDLRAKYDTVLKGRLLNEVSLKAITKTAKGSIATFEGGPKKEGYFARVGDEFWDGKVVEINYDSKTVVVRQQLNDPRLIKPYRDVVIPLYSDEEKKGDQPKPPQG